MAEIFTVYVIYSSKHKKHYVGQTKDIDDRVFRHNSGMVKSTKHFLPWKIIHSEKYGTRSESMKREKWLKSGIGRKFIKELLENFGVI